MLNKTSLYPNQQLLWHQSRQNQLLRASDQIHKLGLMEPLQSQLIEQEIEFEVSAVVEEGSKDIEFLKRLIDED